MCLSNATSAVVDRQSNYDIVFRNEGQYSTPANLPINRLLSAGQKETLVVPVPAGSGAWSARFCFRHIPGRLEEKVIRLQRTLESWGLPVSLPGERVSRGKRVDEEVTWPKIIGTADRLVPRMNDTKWREVFACIARHGLQFGVAWVRDFAGTLRDFTAFWNHGLAHRDCEIRHWWTVRFLGDSLETHFRGSARCLPRAGAQKAAYRAVSGRVGESQCAPTQAD